MQTKPRRTILGFRLLTVVIGLLLLLIIGLYSIRTDNFEGEQNFASRVDYIKDQCDDYTSLSLAAESKSMLRIAEACEQCARDIQTGTDAVEAEVLSRCAENHYLTGVAVLDRDGNVVQYFSKEGALPQQLLQELATAPLLDVADHPKKTYSVRLVCDDDSYLDLAASARTDADGIVAAFYHTPTDYVHSYNLNCQIFWRASRPPATVPLLWPAAIRSSPPMTKACSGLPPMLCCRCSFCVSAAALTRWSMCGMLTYTSGGISAMPRRGATSMSTPTCPRARSTPRPSKT